MHLTAIDKITSKAKPFQYHQNERSLAGRIGVVYGFLVPLIQPLRSILQNERIK